jgi:hypothetical protein
MMRRRSVALHRFSEQSIGSDQAPDAKVFLWLTSERHAR